jgi:hypothetical protein
LGRFEIVGRPGQSPERHEVEGTGDMPRLRKQFRARRAIGLSRAPDDGQARQPKQPAHGHLGNLMVHAFDHVRPGNRHIAPFLVCRNPDLRPDLPADARATAAGRVAPTNIAKSCFCDLIVIQESNKVNTIRPREHTFKPHGDGDPPCRPGAVP